jgi:hypothetical protein
MRFDIFVGELANGQVNDRLSQALSKLVEAVQDTRGKGSPVVTFSAEHEGHEVKVGVKCKTEVPQHPLHSSLFFYVPDKPGEISRDDVRQMKLKGLADRAVLREVKRAHGADDSQDVDPETGEVI